MEQRIKETQALLAKYKVQENSRKVAVVAGILSIYLEDPSSNLASARNSLGNPG